MFAAEFTLFPFGSDECFRVLLNQELKHLGCNLGVLHEEEERENHMVTFPV